MWLTLFAALFGDTAADDGRRAALRETARRLGLPATDAPVPGTRARLDALIRRVEQGGDRQRGVVALRYLVKMTWDDNPSRSILDAEETYPVGTRLVLPVPGRRGRLDPYLTWLFTVSQTEPMSWDEIQELWPGMMDWADATHPNLSAMTWDEALDASDAWHGQFALHRSDEAPSPGVVVAEFSDGARIERLLSRDNLSDEGDTMGHCIGSHYAAVARGDTQVFSYRDPNGMSKATWEVSLFPKPNAFSIGRIEDLEGPENEEVEDRSASTRVPAWLDVTRIEIGEFAPKVGQEPKSSRIVPTTWLPDPPPKLSEAERFLDQQVLDGIEPTRFYGGPGQITATDYVRGAMELLREQSRAVEGALALVRLAQRLDDEDEAQVGSIRSVDPAWTPERVLSVLGSRAAWDQEGAALVEVARKAGYEVDPNSEASLSSFAYVVGFAMRRAIRYAKERAELAETFPEEAYGSASEVQSAARQGAEEAVNELFLHLKGALGVLERTLGLDTRVQKPDDFGNVDETEFSIAEFNGPLPDSSEAFGHSEVVFGVDKDRVVYEVWWVTPYDGRENIGTFSDLFPALARANLLLSVRGWLADLKRAESTLTKHGLTRRLDLAAVYGAPGAVIAASKEAGLPIPPALARRFLGSSGRG